MLEANPQTLNGAHDVSIDTRANLLYADEQRPLSPREVWRLFVGSWRFIHEYRRLVWTKALLATVSLTFFLATPWPLKIVIDNVLDGRALTGLPRALIEPLAGSDPARILTVVMTFLFVAVFLVGMVADRAVALGTDVQSGGLDQAGFTQNDANEGWSLWNGLFGYLETRVTIDLTQRITQSVRTAVYRAFMTSPLGIYSDQKIGDAVFRVMHDSAAVSSVFYRGVLAPMTSIIMFLMTLVVLVAQFPSEPLIPALAALCLPVFAVFATLFGKALRKQSQEMRQRGSQVMAEFEERLAQVQVIKAFGREAHESESIYRASWNSFRSTLRMLVIIMAIAIVLTPTIGFLMYTALYHTMIEVIGGGMTLGDVVLLAGYGALLAFPMATLGNTWAAMQVPAAGLRRIHSVLDRLEIARTPHINRDVINSIREVTFDDVSVGYAPEAPVLRSISFQIHRGEMVALAGPSGTGKTTLILALPGLLAPLAGRISINSEDGRDLTSDDLRDHVGFVFQQEALFSATIEQNIRYGRLDASAQDIRDAAEKAGAAEFIVHLSDGYATMLGRRGARLSVGQKQRIAIARALLARPDMLILDEPTAPLDAASETALIATLREIARDRIVLIVAHRPATLAACDRVLFLRQGVLEASGTHAGLLASAPSYRTYLAESESALEPSKLFECYE